MAALEAPEGSGSFLRVIAGGGDELQAVGIHGRRSIGPRLKIDVEAARGKTTQSSGDALRLGFSGTIRKMRYGLTLRHTDAGYVNPALRGFSRGSFSDRTSGDLSLSRPFGARSLSVTMRRIESGRASQSATTMQWRMPLPRSIALTLSGNASLDEAPASGRLPRSERMLRGLTLSVQKQMAKLTLIQSAGYQSTDDRVNPSGSRNVTTVSTALMGDLTPSVALMTNISGVRSELAFGRQDNASVFVQPSFTTSGGMLRLIPSFGWQRSAGSGSTNVTRQARAAAEWTCAQCIVAFQMSTGWIRNESTAGASRTTREIRVAFALKKQNESP
jgi:hypothetical protein